MSCPYCRREGAPEPSSAPVQTSNAPLARQAPAAPANAAPATAPAAPATGPKAAAPERPRKRLHSARKSGWLLPGILLIVMPKCPICLAAYIALATGISIPITAATWLRTSLIAGCIGALVWLAVRCSLYLYRHYIH